MLISLNPKTTPNPNPNPSRNPPNPPPASSSLHVHVRVHPHPHLNNPPDLNIPRRQTNPRNVRPVIHPLWLKQFQTNPVNKRV